MYEYMALLALSMIRTIGLHASYGTAVFESALKHEVSSSPAAIYHRETLSVPLCMIDTLLLCLN